MPQKSSAPDAANTPVPQKSTEPSVATVPAKHSNTIADYKNYDFVPGDNVIFESDFTNQKDEELPARLGTLHDNGKHPERPGCSWVLHL